MKFHFSKKRKGWLLTLFISCFLAFPSQWARRADQIRSED